MDWDEIFSIQRDMQEKNSKKWKYIPNPNDILIPEQEMALASTYFFSCGLVEYIELMDEFDQLKNLFNSNSVPTQKEIDYIVDNIQTEAVDVLHFILCTIIYWDLDYFLIKSTINPQKVISDFFDTTNKNNSECPLSLNDSLDYDRVQTIKQQVMDDWISIVHAWGMFLNKHLPYKLWKHYSSNELIEKYKSCRQNEVMIAEILKGFLHIAAQCGLTAATLDDKYKEKMKVNHDRQLEGGVYYKEKI